MIPQELINKFFRNECNDDERKRVLQYFDANPEEWHRYMNEEDFDNFETNEQLDPHVSKKLFDRVSRNTFQPNRYKVITMRIAIAASFVLLAGLAWVLLFQKKTTPSAKNDMEVIASLQWQQRVNTTNKAMSFTLEDGSQITLSPNSSIRFNHPFTSGNKRLVYVQGKAVFDVAKDANRPFTVYSDVLATTVLGTRFTVTSFAENNEITVALHEGKVVVQAAIPGQNKWKQDLYMMPGDEVVYNRNTQLASLRHAASKEQLVKAGKLRRNDAKVQKPDWYTFNGWSLAEVFDQLSAYYQVDIYYYPGEVNNKFFTSRLKKTDSLENILRDIALLNHLTIDKKNGAYIIKREK